MITACWIDMLFRKQKTYIFWYTDKTKERITFKDSIELKRHFEIYDEVIGAYQQIPTNLTLRKIWNWF